MTLDIAICNSVVVFTSLVYLALILPTLQVVTLGKQGRACSRWLVVHRLLGPSHLQQPAAAVISALLRKEVSCHHL